jgi:putative Mg2+ transporter-C (MgtC) family protein
VGEEWELLLRTAAAMLAGGLIGWDREALSKPAGIRTHMLVAGGAALFTAASLLILQEGTLAGGRGDLVRIPAAIVTGVGFLGAGAILRSGERVTGLTTAAGIWVTAAIGVLFGSGFWIIGTGGTVLVLLTVNTASWASARATGSGPPEPDHDG